METNRETIVSILAADIRGSTHGSMIPDQLLTFFLEQLTSNCLHSNYLVTDSLAQWLKGEYDFPPDEFSQLLDGLRKHAREKAGVEVLNPGESPPPEVMETLEREPKKELEVEVEEIEEEEEKLILADYDESAAPFTFIEKKEKKEGK